MRLAQLKQVREMLKAGGFVRMTWATGKHELLGADGQFIALVHGNTYQSICHDQTLRRAETGTVEDRTLVMEWRF